MLPNKIDRDDAAEIVSNKKSGSQGSPREPLRAPQVTDESLNKSSETKIPEQQKCEVARKDSGHDDAEKESKLAEYISTVLMDTLCYDNTGGNWCSQNNGLWRVISEKEALKIIMEALDAQIPKGYAISKLNNIKTFLSIYLLLGRWASNRHLLPMANGVLDTQAMQLLKYSHKHRFNWQLPYDFDPSAKIDVIKRWLWDASGKDMESVNIIRAFFKMALVGGDAQKFLELIGPGGTGKSTLIRLLVAFIGKENHVATDLKNLETNRFEAAALYGKRLALISDSSRYGGEVSVLKALTGGDPVRYEKKNQQQSGSFVFDGVVVIASNESIQTADYTSGLIRRRMPINFNRKVTDADKAKWAVVGGIEAAMHKELPGLLNWVMEMTDDEVKKVIGGINGEMTQTQREHLIETNKIAAWLDDNIIINSSSITYVGCSMKKKAEHEISQAKKEKLYANYEEWCDDCGVHPVALNRFTANVMDVCDQLKIDVIDLPKDRYGKSIKGLAIRREQHFNYATPITRKILGDARLSAGDPSVISGALNTSHGDSLYSINLSLTNSPVDDQAEYF